MQSIQHISHIFKILFQLALYALPILLIAFWIFSPSPKIDLHGFSPYFLPHNLEILHPFDIQTKITGLSISFIPTIIQMMVLYFLIQLFSLYEKGHIFSNDNVKYYKKIAYTLLLGQIVHPFYEAFITGAMTWKNPIGHRIIMVSFQGTNIAMIFLALMILLIAWIMAEACKLREEQKYTI